MSVPVVLFGEGFQADGGQLAVIGDVEPLHLHSLAFIHGHGAVVYAPAGTFDGEQPTPLAFFHPLQVVHAVVPAVAGDESGLQPPGQSFFQPIAEVVVCGLAFRLVPPLGIGIYTSLNIVIPAGIAGIQSQGW